MITKLELLLKQNKEISAYLINQITDESRELYFVHEKLETLRATNTSKNEVTIYVDHDGFRGDAKFEALISDEKNALELKLNKAIADAKLINNPFYPLVEKDIKTYESESNIKNYDFLDLGTKMAKDLISLNKEECHFNAIEIFLHKITTVVLNSNGLNKKEVSYKAFIETIPTYDGKESVELYEEYTFNEYDEKYLMERMTSKLNDVKQRYFAKTPEEKLQCKVLLRNTEILELVATLTGDLNYAKTYNKQNTFNIGDKIQTKDDISKLSIYRTNSLNNSIIDFFDADGTKLEESLIIENGTYVNQYGTNRYAYYSNKKPTGLLQRIRVEGTNPYSNIKDDYLDCVSFSGIQVDLNNDYIGGEVRLAYLHKKDNIIPVTGISISAKLSEALNSVNISKETIITDKYEGPKDMLFDNFKIL